MKEFKTICMKRMLSIFLAGIMIFGVLSPLMPMRISAESETYVTAPKINGAVGTLMLLNKTLAAIKYAANESKNNNKSFFESFQAYNYGNAAVNKVEDLSKMMKKEFLNVKNEISGINKSINEIQNGINGLADLIKDTDEKNAISYFKINYLPLLTQMRKGYEGVQRCLDSSLSSVEDLKIAFDQLYVALLDFSGLQNYLTGEYYVNGENIMQIYKSYISSNDPDNASKRVNDFVMDLYSSDVLYRYCLNICYVYQIGYMTMQGKDRYRYEGNKATYTIYMSEMESNFDEIISNQKVVTSKVLDVLTQVLNLSDTCSYITADGAVYTLNIDPEKAVVYKNAKYALSGLSSAYEDIFYGNFEYKVSDSSLAKVTDTGVVSVVGSSGSFKLTCLYEGQEIYSINCIISEQPMSGGYGQKGAPYRIGSLMDYKTFMDHANDANCYGELVNDVDFANESYVVGTFKANLNGNGYSLKNIKSRNKSAICVCNEGTIRNLKLIKGTVDFSDRETDASVGAIAADNKGTISDCTVENIRLSGVINGHSWNPINILVGGIAGNNIGGTIIRCVVSNCQIIANSNGEITTGLKNPNSIYSSAFAGGIAGRASGGKIIDCLSINPKTITSYASSGAYCYKYGWPVVHTHNNVEGHADAFAAGIVSHANNTTISNCIYYTNTDNNLIFASTRNLGMSDNNYFGNHSNCKNIAVILNNYVQNLYYGKVSGDSNHYINDLTLANLNSQERAEFVSHGWVFGTNTLSVNNPNAALVVSNLPDRVAYFKGATFNPAGIEITEKDGTPVVGFTVKADTSSIGSKRAIVTKGGVSVTFDITVNAEVCEVHKWNKGKITKAATCTAKGETIYTCTVCGATKTEATKELGHDFGTWTKANETMHKRSCKRCNKIETDYHNFRNNSCSVCGATKSSVPSPTTDAKIIVDGVVCSSGTGNVKVPIRIEKNPGVASVRLTVNYDESKMKLVGVEDGGILGTAAHSKSYHNGYILSWENDTVTSDFKADGIIATLEFSLVDNVCEGDYPISVTYNYNNNDIMNVKMDPVAFETVSGYIKVTSIILGDIDGNGSVNTRDRMILARALAGWKEYPIDSINLSAADVDGDGKITPKDRLILSRYLARWPGYEKLPYSAQ